MILLHTPMLTLEQLGDRFSDWGSVSQRGIPEIIQNWSNQRIKALQNNLLKNNSTASKRLYQDISGDVSTTPGGYNLSIKMQDYYFWVENGRKPTQGGGDGQLYKNIYEWITNKADLQSKVISKSKDTESLPLNHLPTLSQERYTRKVQRQDHSSHRLKKTYLLTYLQSESQSL
jgi:hypothetical protein